jgi:hypothetical protein
MSNKEFTIKSQLTMDIFLMVYIFLSTICDLYLNSQYSYYVKLSKIIFLLIIIISHLKFTGVNDELSETILSKVNKMSFTFISVALVLISMLATTNIFTSVSILGLVIVLTLLLLTIFRLLLFIYYDRKGIYN